ncbi:DUF5993 family protein [Photobacterium angustum]|uniref:DUF5993 family protein n=1 Tax=Photobacterium angustum TaxID=661 RepID=UPI003D0AB374
MMSLLFLLLLAAMVCGFFGKKTIAYGFFAVSLIIGLYWFNHHATDPLSILL